MTVLGGGAVSYERGTPVRAVRGTALTLLASSYLFTSAGVLATMLSAWRPPCQSEPNTRQLMLDGTNRTEMVPLLASGPARLAKIPVRKKTIFGVEQQVEPRSEQRSCRRTRSKGLGRQKVCDQFSPHQVKSNMQAVGFGFGVPSLGVEGRRLGFRVRGSGFRVQD